MFHCPKWLARFVGEMRLLLLVFRLRRCRFFDAAYYCRQLPQAPHRRLPALHHYLRHGAAAGAGPHPEFDPAGYLAANADVAAAGIDPLVHYTLSGAAEGRLPRPAAGAREPDRRGGHAAAAAASPGSAVKTIGQVPRIVFVTPLRGAPSGLYRVDHAVCALEELGCEAWVLDVADIFGRAAVLAAADVVVLHRVGWTEAAGAVFEAARQAGARLVFDSDDDVFSPGLSDNAGLVDGIRFLTPAQAGALRAGTLACRRALVACDAALAATPHLATRMAAAGKPATTLGNTYGQAFAGRCRQVRSLRGASPGRDGLRLGYASGTSTHQRDFAAIAPVLAGILAGHSGVSLTVVGCLELAEYPGLAPLAGRIEVRPLVPHHELPAELARFDLNLAPLEVDNLFCRSKSAVKYIEAGLVEVATVASAIPAFAGAVRHGETGFVAGDAGQWEAALLACVRDPALVRDLGRAARDHVEREYAPAMCRQGWQAFLAGLGVACPVGDEAGRLARPFHDVANGQDGAGCRQDGGGGEARGPVAAAGRRLYGRSFPGV